MLVIALSLDISFSFVFSMVDAVVEFVFPNIYDSDLLNPFEEQVLLMVNVLTFVMLAVGFVTVVLACVFIYRANANLRSAVVTGLTYSPAWSVGWWFVPIMDLFKPYLVVKEIYRLSHAIGREGADAKPYLLQLWWLFWILRYVVAVAATWLYLSYSFDPSGYFLLSAGESLLYLFAGVCFIVIVSQIAGWQEQLEEARDTTGDGAGSSDGQTQPQTRAEKPISSPIT